AISPEWSATNNVSDIEAFQVFLDEEPVGETEPSELFYTLYNLTDSTAYSFQAKAMFKASSTAEPLETDIVTETTDTLSAPGKPDSPILVEAGGGFIRVRARLPLDSGGADLATVTFEARSNEDNSVVDVTKPVSSPEMVFFGLSAKTSYFVSVYMTNAGGLNGPRSANLEAATTALEAPGPCPPPTVLRVTGGSITLKLNPPADDGYVVYMASNGSSDFQEVATTVGTAKPDSVEVFRLPGAGDLPLRANSRYDFKAVAVNNMDICLAIPASSPLDSGGADITVEWKETTSTHLELSGLVATTVYTVKITVINQTGKESSVSGSRGVAFETAVATPPNSEYGPGLSCGYVDLREARHRVVVGSNTTLFQALNHSSTYVFEDTGGSSILGYHVYRDYELVTPQLMSPPYTDCGNLVASTQYIYGVTAVSSATREEGEMVTEVFYTSSLSTPQSPAVVRVDSASTWLNVTIISVVLVDSLDAATDVEVRARGPNGDSGPSVANFETTNESIGMFVLQTTNDTAPASDAEVTIVARSVLVRIDQSQQRGFVAFSSSSMEVWENASFAKVDLSVHFSDRQTHASIWIRLFNDIYYEGSRTLGVRLVNDNASTAVQLSFNAIVTKKVLVFDDEEPSRVLPKIPDAVDVWRVTGGEIEVRWQAPNGTNSALVSGYLVRVSQPQLASSHFGLFNVTHYEVYATFTNALDYHDLIANSVYTYEIHAFNGLYQGPAQHVSAATSDPTLFEFFVALQDQSRAGLKALQSRDTNATFDGLTANTVYYFVGRVVTHLDTVVVREGAANVTVPVSRIDGSFGDSTFSYVTESDTALAGVNYRFTEGTATLVTNIKRGDIVIPIIDDVIYKPNTTFFVLVTDMTTALNTRTRVVITDNGDAGFLSFTSASFAFLENSDEVNLPIARLGGTNPSAVVQAFIVSQDSKLASGAARFEILDPVLNFTDGTETVNLRLKIRNDSDYQILRDSANISFAILDGGPLLGQFPFTNVSAVDDGDISPPKQCSGLHLLNVSGGFMKLQWTPPLDRGGESVVLSYQVDFNTSGVLVLSVAVNSESEIVYGLSASTTYAVASIGALEAFRQVSCVVPSVCLVSGLTALTNYTVQVRASTFLVSDGALSDPLPVQTSNPDIPEPPPLATIVEVDGETDFVMIYEDVSPRYTMYRLKRNTRYNVKYQVKNSVGPSAFGAVQSITTKERSLPSAPLNLSVTNVTGGAVELTWDEPLDIGGRDITGYAIMIKAATSDLDDVVGYDGKRNSTRRATVYRLTAATLYRLYVLAYTEISNCYQQSEWVPSNVTAVSTLSPTLPGTAPLLLLSRFTGGIIELAWTKPDDTGGVPITRFVLYSVLATGVLKPLFEPASADTLTYIDRDLTEATTYAYIVVAWNLVGESPPSAVLTRKTTAASPPSAPRNVQQLAYKTGAIADELSATALSFVDKSNLVAGRSYEYTIHPDIGGVPIKLFDVQLLLDNTVVSTYSGLGSSYTFRSLLANKLYWVSLLVYNDVDQGGAAITTMTVYEVSRGKVTSVTLGAGATTARYTMLSVLQETDYVVSVSATNALGEGPQSKSVTIRTAPLNAPGAMFLPPLLLDATGTTITCQWIRPQDTGGNPLSVSYELRLLDTSVENPPELLFPSLGTTGTATGLNTQPDAAGEFDFASVAEVVRVLENGTQAAANITVMILNDAEYESPDEMFAIELMTATGEASKGAAKIGVNTTALVRVVDDADAGYISFNQTSYAFSEGVPIINDRIYEAPDEFFFATINVTTGGAVLRNSTAQVTILDDGDTSLPGDTLPPESWYQSFVLPHNGQPPVNISGNFSIISGSKTAQTTSDLSKVLSTGAVLSIVDTGAYVVIGNMSTATKSTVPLYSKHLDGDLLDKTVTKAGLKITTQISVGGLAPLTSYTFQIVAVNALSVCFFDQVAKSEASKLTTTAISPPGVPQIAPVRETGAGISLRLVDPRDTGGSDIKRYTLYYMLNSSTDDSWTLGYSGSTFQAVVAPLASEKAYAFKLSVNNGYFESVNSSEFSRNDGSCKCSVGFIGEAEFGTTSKAFASLSKALSMSSRGDTIFLYPGTYKGSANRNLAVLSKTDVTIRSMRGSNWTKIDCERQGQAFDIVSSTVIFEGLTVQNCVATEGAALHIGSSAVKLVDMVLADASAMQRGGAVYATNATVVLTQSIITNAASGGAVALSAAASVLGLDGNLTGNTASSEGGAVSALGDVTIAGVTISGNTASGMGGALILRDGKHQIRNVTVTKNTAGARGGGFAIVGQVDVTITDSSILENRASAAGGGILYQGTGFLTGCSASRGGGAYLFNADVNFRTAVFDSCTAKLYGGGVFTTNSNITAPTGVAVKNTSAANGGGLGGAIATISAEVAMQFVMINGSTALEQGGGMYARDSNIALRDTVLGNHSSESLGGAMMLVNSKVTHSNVTVSSSVARADGGGVYLSGSSLIALEGSSGLSSLTGNRAGNSGGNIFSFYSAAATVQSVVIAKNNASTLGGGVYITASSAIGFTSAVISQNAAQISGGGIAIQESTLQHAGLNVTLNSAPKGGGVFVSGAVEMREVATANSATPCVVADNVVTGAAGVAAGMFVEPGSQLNASMFAFSGGRATTGGGILVKGGTLRLSSSTVYNNVAQGYGGGIFIDTNSGLTLLNCSVYSNTAFQLGGGIASSGAPGMMNSVKMEDCRVYSNRAVESGGGIVLSRTDLTGRNNEVSGNYIRNDAGGGLAALTEGSIEIRGWSFVDNMVGSGKVVRGTALSFAGGAKVVIANSSILSNPSATLATMGGLIYMKNADTSVQVVNSTLSDGQAFSGGLIYSEDAFVSILNCSLLNGWADNFGGGIFAQNSRVEVRDSLMEGNIAYYDGGGVFIRSGGSLAMSNVQVNANLCQDRGGALFVAPGASVACDIADTQFTANRNFGLGSAIFLGRKNAITMKRCEVRNNGDVYNEGGTLYAVDATVNIDTTIFESNYALKGGAIEISRDAVLAIRNATLRNNSAGVWGGALYTSVRATATLSNVVFDGNRATEGGAIYSIGSSVVSLTAVEVRANSALNFGGGASMKGSSLLRATQVAFSLNRGYTGGAIALGENATLALSSGRFGGNSARDFGGAIYIDTMTRSSDNLLRCSTSVFESNNATAGVDIYWVYSPRFSFFECVDSASTVAASGKPLVSTSATRISVGWWPPAVTSGVSFGVARVTNKSLILTPQESALQEVMNNRELSRPNEAVLWPTVVVRDFYGEIATYDNVTSCTAKRVADAVGEGKNESFYFSPSEGIAVSGGYVTFKDAKVLSTSRTEPYVVGITCKLANNLKPFDSVRITVERCKTGFQNIEGVCDPCKKGYYSAPIRAAGYYLWGGRDSYLSESCSKPSAWAPGDPCKDVDEQNITNRLFACSSKENFDKFWNRKRIYACLSGNEYYPCDTSSACVQEKIDVTRTNALGTETQQCLIGYTGIMCATCVRDYYKVANGMCKPCSDTKDPAVARVANLLAVVPIGLGVVALVLITYYFYDASEREIMEHANAAKKFQIYDADARATTLLLAAKFFVQQRARQLMRRIGERIRRPGTRRHLFDIAPRSTPIPPFRAEKFKILLGFFQIFGGFKKVYEIPWPSAMSRLVDVFSVADFNLVDTTGIECFFVKNYFNNYRLSVIVVVVLLTLTGFLLVWGVMRYRVKLSTLPRHCVRCGLPVFKMLRREAQTVTRRSTLLLKLRAEQEIKKTRLQRRSFSTRMKAKVWTPVESSIDRFRCWWGATRAGKRIHRLATFMQLPASSSEHSLSCPTSHHIQSGDVQGMVVRSNLRLWRARIRLRLNYQSYQNKCIKLFFWFEIMLLFYPELSQRVVGLFYCEEIGNKWYMSRDRSLKCYEGDWLYYLPMTAVLAVVWVIGVPLLFWLILFLKRRNGVDEKLLLLDEPANAQLKKRLLDEMRQDLANRGLQFDDEKITMFEEDLLAEYLYNKKLNEPSTVAQVGFIYFSYGSRFWWFEVWDLGRKLLLNCVISLLAKSGANRIIAGLIVLLVYLSVMLFFQPYKEPSDSALAGATQIQLFITLFCGLILKMGSQYLEPGVTSLLTYVALTTNIATLLYAIFSIVFEKVDAARKLRSRAREEHRRAIQRHVVKLWRRAYGFALTVVYLRDTTIRPMPVCVIMELARRDKLEREREALRVQLELATAAIGNPHDVQRGSIDAVRSESQVDLDLSGAER
ncbi:hypothetical protein PybrP1_011487, partial [[Pythium] brassicae (nom. inval.)]